LTLAVIVVGLIGAACTTHPVPSRVLEPAPTSCPVSPLQSTYGVRSSVPAVRQLAGYVPRWVPIGFGISGVWRSHVGGGSRVTWTDISCHRVIWVTYAASGTHVISELGNGGHVGAWTVGVSGDPVRDPRQCANAMPKPGTCVLFYAAKTSKGTVSIISDGVSRADGDRVALSIPL
jgi:hypothetical protein